MAEKNEALTKTDETPLATSGAQMIAMLDRAARDEKVDVAKMRELYQMVKDVRADEAIRSFRAAKARLAKSLPQIGKAGTIVHGTKLISRYVLLEDIDTVIRPLLADEGFSFSFDSIDKGAKIEYTAELSHRDGHAEKRSITVSPDTSGAKNNIQAVGSSTTYARRYLIEMHLNLIERGKDDDGNGGLEPITKEHADALRKMLADAREAGLAGFEDARFLKSFQINAYEDLLDRDFEMAKKRIENRRVECERK